MLLVAERQRMAAPVIEHAPDHSKHGVFNTEEIPVIIYTPSA